MKITYTVMPTGDPVRIIDNNGGGSIARRAIKTTLENLKRWCARLRLGATTHVVVVVVVDRQIHLDGIPKVSRDSRIMPMMRIDQEESRNRANENLENELRESLTSNSQSKAHQRRRGRLRLSIQ